jgi:hypothetical protein
MVVQTAVAVAAYKVSEVVTNQKQLLVAHTHIQQPEIQVPFQVAVVHKVKAVQQVLAQLQQELLVHYSLEVLQAVVQDTTVVADKVIVLAQ